MWQQRFCYERPLTVAEAIDIRGISDHDRARSHDIDWSAAHECVQIIR